METVSVIGGGSFGTVIANIVAGNGYQVNFWLRNEESAAEINETRENSRYLPGYQIHSNVHATTDLEAAVASSSVVFVAVPSAFFRIVVKKLAPVIPKDALLISTTKGIEADTFLLMSQVMQQELPEAAIGVLSGPNLAREIAQQSLTGTVIASPSETVRERVREMMRSDYFRVYTNDDMYGVELGGSLKNIYAIIAGLASAMGMGHNTNAMLVTRSLTEMARFGREMGADPMTFLGLAGVGDLIVTCSSSLSRNFRVGLALGEGKTMDEAVGELGQVAEGVNTLKQVQQKAREMNVYMPLADGLYQIVYEGKTVDQVLSALMHGEGALDVEFEAHRSKQL
jgi:glycerol-3-phosphate dehydrogenase (NAD(P)+)